MTHPLSALAFVLLLLGGFAPAASAQVNDLSDPVAPNADLDADGDVEGIDPDRVDAANAGADGDPGTGDILDPSAEAAVTLQGDQTAAVEDASAPWWVTLLVVLGVFVLPFVVSWLIGRGLRMKDVPQRLGVVLFLFALGLTPFIYNGVVAANAGQGFTAGVKESVKLGIDLAGGTNMVFQVDREKSGDKEITGEVMDRMVGAIVKRINPSGTEEVTVRRVGQDRVELIVPGADPEKVERIRRSATTLGNLEFLILANETDDPAAVERGRTLPGTQRDVRIGSRVVARWVDIGRNKDKSLALSPFGDAESRVAARIIDADGQVLRNPPAGLNDGPIEGVRVQYLARVPKEKDRVTGQFLTRARSTRDERGGPAVGFFFSSQGGYRFGRLTGSNVPGRDGFARRLAVVLDEEIRSAPTINSQITTNGTITGRFTTREVDELVDVFNAGALEVPLDPTPVSEFTVSPLLGADTVRKAVFSILGAGLLVLVFMALYYRTLGLVADLCLVLNIVLVLGAMSLIEATFTLPGLAGIVLTIGMAVDANVLIFERIREEQARGSSLRMSIQNGFAKAFTTIVDANVTTLITALILFLIGTDQVRGFAVTLFIGILTSMFTALYFGRLVCDLLERKRWVKKFKMFSVVGKTEIDFVSKSGLALAGSAIVLLLGVGLIVLRGADLLDIDFRGGTMVTFQLEQERTAPQVKQALEDEAAFESGVSVEQLVLESDGAGESGRRFRVRTTLRDRQVQDDPDAFGGADGVATLVARAFEASELNVRRIEAAPGSVETLENARRAVNVRFSEPVGVSTVVRELGDATAELAAATGRDFGDAKTLYEVRGLGESSGGTGEAGGYGEVRVVAGEALPAADFDAVLAGFTRDLAESPVFDEVNSFDSAVAGEMQRSAILAVLASLIAIVGYIWFRFQRVDFGLAAVAALVHDVLFVLGAVALANWLVGGLNMGPAVGWLGFEEFKLNLPMIAALLTVIGYSLNDTIVVFDRVREVRGKNPGLTADILNRSLNQTLSRTLLTSVTTLIVVGILYAFGGEGIHGFAYCLVVGILVGTYSSLFIAAPVLLYLMNRGVKTTTATGRPVDRVEPAPAKVA